MQTIISTLPLAVAAMFAAVGAVHLAGPLTLRQTYHRWGYPAWFSLLVGLLDVVAALMLAEPEMRAFGIVLSAVIIFFAVVQLLDHEKYYYALPLVIVMLSLIPATLSIPSHARSAPYTIERPAQLSQD